MARTTAQKVQSILLKDYDRQRLPSLIPFIESASVIVDRVAACAVEKERSLTGSELELIERWLAAHMYATSDRPYQSKSTGDASATFVGNTGMGLEATYYGQTALSIDYSGCLATLAATSPAGAAKIAPSVAWLGKSVPQQLDYRQRN